MPPKIPKNLYNLYTWPCTNRKIYDKNNNFIGTYTGFSTSATATSDGHIEICTSEGKNMWIRGKGVYIEGIGIKLTSNLIIRA